MLLNNKHDNQGSILSSAPLYISNIWCHSQLASPDCPTFAKRSFSRFMSSVLDTHEHFLFLIEVVYHNL